MTFLVGIANGEYSAHASAITCFNTLLAGRADWWRIGADAAFIAQEEDDGWLDHCPGVLGAIAGGAGRGHHAWPQWRYRKLPVTLPGEADALPWQVL